MKFFRGNICCLSMKIYIDGKWTELETLLLITQMKDITIQTNIGKSF